MTEDELKEIEDKCGEFHFGDEWPCKTLHRLIAEVRRYQGTIKKAFAIVDQVLKETAEKP